MPDPLYVLMPPKKCADALPLGLWKALTATLATRFDKPASHIRKFFPKETRVVQYGRARRLEGGDTIQAHKIVIPQTDSRDMTFVRVCALIHIVYLISHLPFY